MVEGYSVSARAALGAEPFAAAWSTGRALSLEQAVAKALAVPAAGRLWRCVPQMAVL